MPLNQGSTQAPLICLYHLFLKCYYNETFTKLHKTSNCVIPAPDKDIRGQVPAGIYSTAVIPAKAGIQY